MKKNRNDLLWYILTAVILVSLSITLYSIQVMIFHNKKDTYFYFLQDVSFVPLQVLFVTFFIDRLMKRQQKASLLKRVYVTIGIFYSELGNDLLKLLFDITSNRADIQKHLQITTKWKPSEFKQAENSLIKNPAMVELTVEKAINIKNFMDSKRTFLLNLLENSNLTEHETFTDTLLAVCHLSDELALRREFAGSPAADIAHLAVDINRAYHGIIREWIFYMNHIRQEYPFLYSLAVRSNPFNSNSSAVIENY